MLENSGSSKYDPAWGGRLLHGHKTKAQPRAVATGTGGRAGCGSIQKTDYMRQHCLGDTGKAGIKDPPSQVLPSENRREEEEDRSVLSIYNLKQLWHPLQMKGIH